jgi:poly(3-hydroxybutyrate) depolymerase
MWGLRRFASALPAACSGHVWPGGKQDVNQKLLGRPTSIIDANTLTWRFFEQHPLPRSSSGRA